MKRFSIYRKFIIINILIALLSAISGMFITKRIMQMIISENKIVHIPEMFAKSLVHENFKDNSEKLQLLKSIIEDDTFSAGIWVFDKNKNLLYSNTTDKSFPFPPNYKFEDYSESSMIKPLDVGAGIITYPKEGKILVYQDFMKKKVKPHLILVGVMITSMILGMTILSIILFYFLRKKAFSLDKVINELKRGNLKARFPIKKLDELGLAMTRFNAMADEIERLVEELRNADIARVNLLQELAHDLRTPVSSMKTMLETMVDKWDKRELFTEDKKRDFANLCLHEVNYFARLVEDLLFLGRVSEPKYNLNTEDIDILSIVENEVDVVESQYPQKIIEVTGESFKIIGDRHLMGRLLRNGLINAARYAKKNILVEVKDQSIFIQDDGPGFPDHILLGFGEKKFSRVMDLNGVSVGLGSVIMKRLAEIHKGKITVRNAQLNGAIVIISFK